MIPLSRIYRNPGKNSLVNNQFMINRMIVNYDDLSIFPWMDWLIFRRTFFIITAGKGLKK